MRSITCARASGCAPTGRSDPLNEYKTEAFALFNGMLDELKERVTTMLGRVELTPEAPPAFDFQPHPGQYLELHPDPTSAFGGGEPGGGDVATLAPPVAIAAQPLRAEAVDPDDPATWRATPRNAPCPCGSGKKYKHCHGRLA